MTSNWFPDPTFQSEILMITKQTQEMLDYCAAGALQENDITYDQDTDHVIYHYKPDDTDRELFKRLEAVSEVWIITDGIGRLPH